METVTRNMQRLISGILPLAIIAGSSNAQDYYDPQLPFRYGQIRRTFIQNLSSECVRKYAFQLREKTQPFCDCFAGQMADTVTGDEGLALSSGNPAALAPRANQATAVCAAVTGAQP